jgi:hypothetical protein
LFLIAPFTVLIILVLLPAELHVPTKRLQQLYADNLPILSPLHGLGMLGIIQCWIAAVVLGKYVGVFEQVTGWIGFIVGCCNGLAVRGLSGSGPGGPLTTLNSAHAGYRMESLCERETQGVFLGKRGTTVSLARRAMTWLSTV